MYFFNWLQVDSKLQLSRSCSYGYGSHALHKPQYAVVFGYSNRLTVSQAAATLMVDLGIIHYKNTQGSRICSALGHLYNKTIQNVNNKHS